MARRTVYLGSNVTTRVDTRGGSMVPASWPDLDVNGNLADAGIQQLQGARAIALAYDTDWDLVRVYLAGVVAPVLLGPGRILELPGGQRVQRIEPVTACPSTRLYDASQTRNGVGPSKATAQKWQVVGDVNIQNVTAGPLTIYKWQNPGWDAGTAIAAGANAPCFVAQNAANRPADYSPDKLWSFADYLEAQLLVSGAGLTYNGQAFVSQLLMDMHGNIGDPTLPTTLLYGRYWAAGQLSQGALSPLFYGRLAIDVFDDDCYPRDAGRLAPARMMTLAAIAVAHGAAAPDTAILTVPIINAEGVEVLLKNTGANNLFAQLVSPHADDLITSAAGVPYTDATSGLAFATVPAGAELSLVMATPRHPFVKLVVGADVGGTTIGADSLITVKRALDQ